MSSKRVPNQLRRQLEAATEIEQQMFAVPVEEAQTPPEAVVEEPVAPVTQPVAPDDDIEVWKQRYRTLQGTFNAKMPELQGQVADLKTQLQQAIDKLNQVEQTRELPKLTTEKDVEEFGEDMLDLITRRAKESWAEEKAELLAQINEMRQQFDGAKQQLGQVAETQMVTAQSRFESELSKAVPDWESVNVEPGFLEWLSHDDPLSGVNRGELLNKAGAELNVPRVAVFFKQYLSTKPQAPQAPANDTLAQQVTPARSANAAGGTPSGAQPKVWAAADWQSTYQSLRRVPASPERDAIEAELNLAMAEGRIRP